MVANVPITNCISVSDNVDRIGDISVSVRTCSKRNCSHYRYIFTVRKYRVHVRKCMIRYTVNTLNRHLSIFCIYPATYNKRASIVFCNVRGDVTLLFCVLAHTIAR